jgi:hypothetical protein
MLTPPWFCPVYGLVLTCFFYCCKTESPNGGPSGMLPPCPPCRVYNSPRSPEIKNGNNSASKRQKLGPTLFGTPSPPMTILFPTFLVESLVRPNSRRARHWKSWTKFLPLRVNYFSVFRNPEKYVFVVHSVR